MNWLSSHLTRRTFLGQVGPGLGLIALASMLKAERGPPAAGGVALPPHVPARVRRVIFLYMSGGPSQLETFDYKPRLAQMHGQPMPESYTHGQPIAQLQGRPLTCFAPQFSFGRYGQSGQHIADILPHIGSVADELCILRAVQTEPINHDPAHTFMNTGTSLSGRPAMGSWVCYGLGSECAELPGFLVLTSAGRVGSMQPILSRIWHSGFLPSRFQGVQLRATGDPVLYLSSPPGVSDTRQRDVLQAVESLNRMRDSVVDDPEIATRIAQYEMAFRMQTSVPALMDLSAESASTLAMYGLDRERDDGGFARNCLLARRLAERGVRFIQLYHRDWDHHRSLRRDLPGTCREVDQPCAALVRDLKQRGLLDETLVIWGGEFGRTPMAQDDGRDHHIRGFSMWLAGGGVRPGITFGTTDELGYNAVEDVVHVHDLHATILHLLGIDHTRLTHRFQGRDFRLTDVAGQVVHDILA